MIERAPPRAQQAPTLPTRSHFPRLLSTSTLLRPRMGALRNKNCTYDTSFPMTEIRAQDPTMTQLLQKMVVARQLSAIDAKHLAGQQTAPGGAALENEEDILRWLAHEYGLSYTTLDDIEP